MNSSHVRYIFIVYLRELEAKRRFSTGFLAVLQVCPPHGSLFFCLKRKIGRCPCLRDHAAALPVTPTWQNRFQIYFRIEVLSCCFSRFASNHEPEISEDVYSRIKPVRSAE